MGVSVLFGGGGIPVCSMSFGVLRCVVIFCGVRFFCPMSNAGARLLVLKSERSLLERGRVWTPGKHRAYLLEWMRTTKRTASSSIIFIDCSWITTSPIIGYSRRLQLSATVGYSSRLQ